MKAPRSRGFTYVGLIVLVAIVGLAATCSVKLGALLQRRAAEQQLLEVGSAFSEALESYAAATPRGQPREPMTLQDLLRDPRFPSPRRHLRKLYLDPITGSAEWGIIRLDTGPGIVGVYSLSQAHPIKVANFDEAHADFAGKSAYRQWEFGIEQARARVLGRRNGGGLASPLELHDPSESADSGKAAAADAEAAGQSDRVSPLHME